MEFNNLLTNEEKARECSSTQIRHIKDEFCELDNYLLDVIEAEAIVQNLQMAEWKDKQFKEYLQNKIDTLCEFGCKTDSSEITKSCADKMVVLGEIINELFIKK